MSRKHNYLCLYQKETIKTQFKRKINLKNNECERWDSKNGFKDSYKPYINSINYEEAQNLVSKLVSLMIQKYGKENIKFEMDNGNQNSIINNFFTHIIEVGALTVISESDINVKEIKNFTEIIVLVSI